MFWNYPTYYNVASYIVSKYVNDISDMDREDIINFLSKLENYGSKLEDINPNRPETWISAGSGVARDLIQSYNLLGGEGVTHSKPVYKQILGEEFKGVTISNRFEKYLFEDIICRENIQNRIDINPDESTSEEYVLIEEDNLSFYIHLGLGTKFKSFKRERFNNSIADVDIITKEDLQTVLSKVLEIFWKNKSYVNLSFSLSSGDIKLNHLEHQQDDTRFFGKEGRLIDEIEMAIEQGKRRCILLDGKPGTGKTTLALNISKRFSKRTVIVDYSFIDHQDLGVWKEFLAVLEPDMVIFDDLDRISTDLTRKLSWIDKNFYNVPITFITTNHLENIPEAFYRPGRVDHIYRMKGLTDEQINQSIKYKMENVLGYFDEDVFKDCKRVYEELETLSHVEEFLERISLYGKDYEPIKNDIVYGFMHQSEEENDE